MKIRFEVTSAKIKALLEGNNNELPSHAFPGGYPLFYVDGDNSILCPTCANKSLEGDYTYFHPVDFDTNWEDPHMYCDECSKHIESAYGEEETEGVA
ncbi:hypothetical protein [Paenibacillus hexagrammi]|uniref:Uncharacterized protein n=1 Tax=Paenibacillus hexagrammi TaxID=2908839 RepID=A0ABY3SR53_9BACL|nr:hypothetical protein [Paenibacillus sp. YPD9-1]UJF36548.1 hypothetical protein L0M14_30640 [Paenibacillus sp. YPD9-1]